MTTATRRSRPVATPADARRRPAARRARPAHASSTSWTAWSRPSTASASRIARGARWGSWASRLRQERDRADRSCGCWTSRPREIASGRDPVRGPGPAEAPGGRDAQAARQRDGDDLPGADEQPQPGVHQSATRSPRRSGCTCRCPKKEAARAGHRGAPAGRHRVPRAARQAVSARAVGRHAPARDDRHGALLRAEAAHRRRADDRARRDHPGADPASSSGSIQERDRRGAAAHHPRPRRRRRDGRRRRGHVRRPGRRARHRRGGPARSRGTPTPRACSPPSPPRACAASDSTSSRGTVPNPFNMPAGCNFAPRCPYRFEPCATLDPRLDEVRTAASRAGLLAVEAAGYRPAPVAADGRCCRTRRRRRRTRTTRSPTAEVRRLLDRRAQRGCLRSTEARTGRARAPT